MPKSRYFDILNICKILGTFKYGTLVNDKFKPGLDVTAYKSLSPEEFIINQDGVCWDFTNFEADWFDKQVPEIFYKLYYIEYANGLNTHTWLGFRYNKNWVAFEASLLGHKGLFAFRTEADMLKYYVKELTKYYSNKAHTIYTYNQPKTYGMTAEEFLHHILTTGHEIRVSRGYTSRFIV